MDRGRGGKTTSGNGQALSSTSPRGQWRRGKIGENWLQNHLWCPNDPDGEEIDDDGDLCVCVHVCVCICVCVCVCVCVCMCVCVCLCVCVLLVLL